MELGVHTLELYFPDLPPRARPAKEEGYVVIKQLVTVHCSFLYFELVSTIA